MSAMSVQRQAGPVWRRLLGAAAATFLLATAAGGAETVTVVLDRATVIKMPDKVATLVIGNPLIADVSLQPGGVMVLTGKGYGTTNVLALDRTGAVLMEKSVQVQGPRDDLIVVYRGVQQESYSCAPNCERRITLGDDKGYFDAALTQADSRTGAVQKQAQPK